MSNLWGFDIANQEEQQQAKNLTAGKYKLLIESVEIGMKDAQTNKYRTITNPAEAGKGLIIQVSCLLAADSGEFKEGWKHNMFFRPLADGVAGDIARSQFKRLANVCGCSADPQPSEFEGKMFMLELVQQKDNPEYTNIKRIDPVDGSAMAASTPKPQPAASVAQPLPLGSKPAGTEAQASNPSVPSWE